MCRALDGFTLNRENHRSSFSNPLDGDIGSAFAGLNLAGDGCGNKKSGRPRCRLRPLEMLRGHFLISPPIKTNIKAVMINTSKKDILPPSPVLMIIDAPCKSKGL